jgi:uncharacterized membrane protein YcaP (DUF421 family)
MPGWLHATFALDAPLVEKIVRPIIVYLVLVVLLRIFGKRELAQLNPFDLVVLLSLSNTVQNAIIGNDNSLTGGLIGALTLLAVNYLVVRFLFRHRRLDQILEGEPSTLIEHGKVIPGALAKELLTRSELITVLHRQGYHGIEDIDHCVLEPGGVFYVERKEPPLDERQRVEVLARLAALQRDMEALRRDLSGGGAASV